MKLNIKRLGLDRIAIFYYLAGLEAIFYYLAEPDIRPKTYTRYRISVHGRISGPAIYIWPDFSYFYVMLVEKNIWWINIIYKKSISSQVKLFIWQNKEMLEIREELHCGFQLIFDKQQLDLDCKLNIPAFKF